MNARAKGQSCRHVAWILTFVGLVFWAEAKAAEALLPPALAETIARNQIPPSSLSVVALRFTEGQCRPQPLLAFNAGVARNPASVMKLLTTLVALETLGRAYTWRTEGYVRGELRAGRLQGDLLLKGYGDPQLTPERFVQLLRGLRQRGLRIIEGDVLLDASHFEPPRQGRGDFDGRPSRVYNALPHALSLNFQATRLHMYPDRSNGRIHVFSDPPLANLRIRNALKLVRAPCERQHHRPRMTLHKASEGVRVHLRGSYAAECSETTVARLLMDPVAHMAGAFDSLWRELGGEHRGRVRTARLVEGARLHYALESDSLDQLIRGMNKFSNNLMSRALLLTLGAERYGPPGTVEKGRRVILEWLEEHRLNFPELHVENGSGLSRRARISAQHMARLLTVAYRGPYMPEFLASLAIAGVDGTLLERFAQDELKGRVHAKTGSLNGVSTFAGYVLDRLERRWIVVLFINHEALTSGQGKQVQDALLHWVFDLGTEAIEDAPQLTLREQGGCGEPGPQPSLMSDGATTGGSADS